MASTSKIKVGDTKYAVRDQYLRDEIEKLVVDHKHIKQIHGFYVDEENKRITFDVVVDFDEKDRAGLVAHITDDVKNALPEYEIVVALDSDISDQ